MHFCANYPWVAIQDFINSNSNSANYVVAAIWDIIKYRMNDVQCKKCKVQSKMYIIFRFSMQITMCQKYGILSTAECKMYHVQSRYIFWANFVVAAILDIINRRGYAWLPSLLYTSLRSDGPVSTSSATSLSSTLSSTSLMSLLSTLSSTSPSSVSIQTQCC